MQSPGGRIRRETQGGEHVGVCSDRARIGELTRAPHLPCRAPTHLLSVTTVQESRERIPHNTTAGCGHAQPHVIILRGELAVSLLGER